MRHGSTASYPISPLTPDEGYELEHTIARAFGWTFSDETIPRAPPVRCAGVTGVAVLPTHRRRGVLSGLMRRQIDGLRAAQA